MITQSVVITEFLRPENSHEPVVYDVPPNIAEKVEALNVKGMTVCCDIYPSGRCSLYIYDPITETSLAHIRMKQHSVAVDLLIELIGNFDLQSIT